MIKAYALCKGEAVVIICFDEDLAEDLSAEYELDIDTVEVDDRDFQYSS